MNDVLSSFDIYLSKKDFLSWNYYDESVTIKSKIQNYFLQNYPSIPISYIRYFTDNDLPDHLHNTNRIIMKCILIKNDENIKELVDRLIFLDHYLVERDGIDKMVDIINYFFEEEIKNNKQGIGTISKKIINPSFFEIIIKIFYLFFFPIDYLLNLTSDSS